MPGDSTNAVPHGVDVIRGVTSSHAIDLIDRDGELVHAATDLDVRRGRRDGRARE
jgi:hypothetical protein